METSAVSSLAAILLNEHRFGDALPHIERFRALLSLDPKTSPALRDHADMMHGRCLEGLGRYDDGIAAFARIRGGEAQTAQQHIDAIRLVQPLLLAPSEDSRAQLHATLASGMDEQVMFIASQLVEKERAAASPQTRGALCGAEADFDLARNGDFGNEALRRRLAAQCEDESSAADELAGNR